MCAQWTHTEAFEHFQKPWSMVFPLKKDSSGNCCFLNTSFVQEGRPFLQKVEETKNKNSKSRVLLYILQFYNGFIFNLEFDFCQWRLRGLDAENTVKHHSWPNYGWQHLPASLALFSGDVSTEFLHPTSKRQCLQHGQARALVVVACSQYCH